MNKLTLLVKVSRPLFWPIGPLIFLSGLFYCKGTLNYISFFQLICLTFPIGLVAFGLNDIYDYESDRHNQRKNSIWGIVLKPRYHKFVFNSALLCSLLLFISSLSTGNLLNIVSMITLILCLFLYSVKPIRLKEMPPLDSISNGVIVLSTFFLGYSFGSGVPLFDKQILLLTLCVSTVHTYTTLADHSPDLRAKMTTFAIKYGKRFTAFVPLAAFFLALVFGSFKWPITSFLVISTALFSITVIVPSERLANLFSKLIFACFILFSFLYILTNLEII